MDIASAIAEMGYRVKELEEVEGEEEKIPLRDVDIEEIAKDALRMRGIESLYSFQLKAMEEVKRDRNVIVVAPTASGKSEVFMYAAIRSAKRGERTLVIYPTKALSRDQLERFGKLRLYGIETAVYDGDTPQGKREKIRANPPHILITNFDMLHFILLNHKKFSKFFSTLSTIVIDEFHVYTGIFGSHVGNIIERLKRVAEKAYGRRLKFLLTSATVKNAKEFAESIVGEEFELVKGKGRGKRVKHLIVIPQESYLTATVKIAKLIGGKLLIFANSHGSVERLGLIARKAGINLYVYRAGLSRKERERLEHAFRNGNIMLASTSALELGIDIGDVNTVIIAGFPGSISSIRQRIGRAGRKGEGLAIFIPRESPLDAYYADHPEEYVYGEGESCYANPQNPYIRRYHVLAKAKEMLVKEGEEELAEELEKEGLLRKFGKFYGITKEGAILARKLSIRGVGEQVRILEGDREIGRREKPLAITELYEGALYLHGGRFYISEELDLEKNIARVSRYDRESDVYTKALSDKEAEILEVFEEKEWKGYKLSRGRIRLTTSVIGFLVKDIYSNRTLGEHMFSSPYVYEMETHALWLDFEEMPDVESFGDGLHALEHVAIGMSPLLTANDDRELGGISYETGRMFIYEGIPGGVGLVEQLFNEFPKLISYARKRLYECDCYNGCPKCILDPNCGNDNRYLNKESAKLIADWLLNHT